MTTNEQHEASIAAFRAERQAIVSRMGLRTTAQYLAGTAHLVDPDPRAGTDWEFLPR